MTEADSSKTLRAALSVRIRFEVFKRDEFTCRYCGRTSPEAVLEIDHIIPVSGGGSNDEINLVTSCWDCNRGKADKPLTEVITGEDPYDRAIMLLERERQLEEYNAVLAVVNARIHRDADTLEEYWGRWLSPADRTGLENLLRKLPFETVLDAMKIAIRNHKTHGLAYVHGVLNRHERKESEPAIG